MQPLLYNLIKCWEMNQAISIPVSDEVSALRIIPSKQASRLRSRVLASSTFLPPCKLFPCNLLSLQ